MNERDYTRQNIDFYTDLRDGRNYRGRIRMQTWLQRFYGGLIVLYLVEIAVHWWSIFVIFWVALILLMIFNIHLSRKLTKSFYNSYCGWTRQILWNKMRVIEWDSGSHTARRQP